MPAHPALLATIRAHSWKRLINTVQCADALDLLRSLPDGCADAVITDPPYGLGGRVFEFPHKHYSAINEAWDMFAPVDWMDEVGRVLRPSGSVICFGVRQSIYEFAAKALSLKWRLVNDVTWVKPDAPPNFTGRMMAESTERFLWFCPSGTGWTYNLSVVKAMNGGINLRDVWYYSIERNNRLHPSQKPLALMTRIVQLITRPGDLVIDPFCGSGTTALAARACGRRWICGDLDTGYVQIARDRLAQPYTLPLFAESPAEPPAEQIPLFDSA